MEVKITDVRGRQSPTTKTVSLTLADREGGQARSQVDSPYGKTSEFRTAYLNIDARPEIEGDKVRLRLSLDYNLIDSADMTRPPISQVKESVGLVLDSGRPVVVAESADPATDRRVRLEVTATILR